MMRGNDADLVDKEIGAFGFINHILIESRIARETTLCP
jgi:hypothetical protein